MFPIKSLDKTTNDLMYVENNPVVSYTQLNSSFPINNESNTIPKIKIEEISYESDYSTMNWQRSDCYQPNQFNEDNCLYHTIDGRIQTNNYSDSLMPSSSCANGLVYTDLSNPCNQLSVNTEDYNLMYAQNSVNQQNVSLNESNYQNKVENGADMLRTDQLSAITSMKIDVSIEQKSDCLQTLEPTVMSAMNDTSNLKNIQFIKTIEFLRATDLLNLTLQTAELIKKNLEIQKEINQTKQLLSRFVTT